MYKRKQHTLFSLFLLVSLLVTLMIPSMVYATSSPVTFTPNGSTTPAKSITVTVSYDDNDLSFEKYAWSTSNSITPASFSDLSNKTLAYSNVTGTYYLWIRSGNHSPYAYYKSNSFILDNTKPSITAPADVEKEAAGALTAVTLGEPTVSDLVSSGADLVVTNDAPADGFPVGKTIVAWTVGDKAGNQATATQTVTIKDTTKPSITAPADVEKEAAGALTAVTLGKPTVSDLVSSGDDLVVTNDTPKNGFPAGKTTVTWTVEDKAGNKAIATQDVTITGFSVSFDANSGNSIESQDLEYGDLVQKPQDPTRSGFEFKGWYADESLTDGWDFDTDTVSQDVILHARWLQVTYNLNDQATGVSSSSLASSVKITEELDPSFETINLKLDVEEIAKEDQPNFIITAAAELNEQDKELIKAFDLSLIKTLIKTTGDTSTVKVENSDIVAPITIRLPLPAAYANRGALTVVYIDDEGSMTTMPTTLVKVGEEYFLEFTTNHFSAYAIIANQLMPLATGENDSPLAYQLLLLAAALYILSRLYKRQLTTRA